MYKSLHTIIENPGVGTSIYHPIDQYKIMRNIKQHMSILLEMPAEK